MLKALPSCCNLVNCFLSSKLDYCFAIPKSVCLLSLSSKQLNITQVSWRLFCIRSTEIVAPFRRDCTQFNAQLKWMQRRVTSAICLGFKSNDCISFPLSLPLSLSSYRLPAGTCSSLATCHGCSCLPAACCRLGGSATAINFAATFVCLPL